MRGMDLGIIIAVVTIGFIIASFVFARVVAKRMLGTSKGDAAKIEQLMATGSKARATLTAITPTGLTVNNFNVQVKVDFWLEPLDGSPPFEASKKIFCLKTQFPRQGDIWPSWFDRADHSSFVVGAPGKLDPQQIALYREFGIEHPLDT